MAHVCHQCVRMREDVSHVVVGVSHVYDRRYSGMTFAGWPGCATVLSYQQELQYLVPAEYYNAVRLKFIMGAASGAHLRRHRSNDLESKLR